MPKRDNPKKYAKLNSSRERCVYEAFEWVASNPPERLADYVNAHGYDADDTEAVDVLAKKFGFGKPEFINGNSVESKDYRFDCSAQFVVVVALNNSPGTKRACEHFLGSSPHSSKGGSKEVDKLIYTNDFGDIYWHAIYGTTDGSSNITWKDKQKLFPDGPKKGHIAMVYMRKPVKTKVLYDF